MNPFASWTETDVARQRAKVAAGRAKAAAPISVRGARKKQSYPEMQLHQQVAAFLASLPRSKQLKPFCYYHVPNEGQRTRWERFAALSQGMRAGVSDWVVHWQGGSMFLEGKVGRNKLSKAQQAWKQEAEQAGVPFVVFRSLEAFVRALVEHGLVREGSLR